MEASTCNLQDLKDLLLMSVYHSTPSEVFRSPCVDGSQVFCFCFPASTSGNYTISVKCLFVFIMVDWRMPAKPGFVAQCLTDNLHL